MPQISPGASVPATSGFLVDGYSEVHGGARKPQRLLLTFTVDDAALERSRLEDRGVRFVRPRTQEPWGGFVATFEDPNGNYCQLVEYPKA